MAPAALNVAAVLLTVTYVVAACGSPPGQEPRPLTRSTPQGDYFRGRLGLADTGQRHRLRSSVHRRRRRRRRCCFNAAVSAPLRGPRRGLSSLSSSLLPDPVSPRTTGPRTAPRKALGTGFSTGSLGFSGGGRGYADEQQCGTRSSHGRSKSQRRLSRNRGERGVVFLASAWSSREPLEFVVNVGRLAPTVGRGRSSNTRLAATAGRDGDAAEGDNSKDKDPNETTSAAAAAAAASEKRVRSAGAVANEQNEPHKAEGLQGWVDGAVAKFKEAFPEPAEAKKILPLGLMLFFILFDYTILRDTKDVLVVTAPNSGAEVIPFLKTYVNLPGAVAFTVLYSKLCNSVDQKRVFYTVMGFFLSFFAVFAAFLYPNRDVLSTAALADSMQAFLPEGLSALSSIVRNWTFSAFYLMSELWGSVVVSVLFWGFANDIVSVSEAKRFYPLFGLGANVALVFSGQYVRLVSSVRQSLPPDVDKWGVSLQLLMGAVVVGGVVVAGCYEWMQQNVITDLECVDASRAADMKETTSLTLRESAVFLAGNAYLRDVAVLVIAYGTSINIVEVTWKAKLKMAYPDPNAYSAFMGNFSTTTGLVTLGMMLLGRQVFKNYGWGSAAKATPVVLLVTGVAFFSLSLFGDAAPVQAMLGALSTSPLMLAVLAGGAQNVLSKSCKYSLFDPCKEMAYIPLSPEEKRKGKAAVDVIGNPLGKSTGSFVQQGLFLATGSLQASTPYLGGVLLVVITTWLFAAESLSKKFEEAMVLVEAAVTDKKVSMATAVTAAEDRLEVEGKGEVEEAGVAAAVVTLTAGTTTDDGVGAGEGDGDNGDDDDIDDDGDGGGGDGDGGGAGEESDGGPLESVSADAPSRIATPR